MPEKFLCFDINTKEWTELSDNDMEEKYLEEIPMTVFIEYDGLQLLWDIKRKDWFVVAWCNGMEAYTTDGAYIRGLPILLGCNSIERSYTVPVLWSVKIIPERKAVFVGVEFAELVIQENGTLPEIEKICRRKYGNCTYEMDSGRYYAYQDYQNQPLMVIRIATEYMQSLLEQIYGRKPIFTSDDLQQKNFLEALCFQPYDFKCFPLERWIGFLGRDTS